MAAHRPSCMMEAPASTSRRVRRRMMTREHRPPGRGVKIKTEPTSDHDEQPEGAGGDLNVMDEGEEDGDEEDDLRGGANGAPNYVNNEAEEQQEPQPRVALPPPPQLQRAPGPNAAYNAAFAGNPPRRLTHTYRHLSRETRNAIMWELINLELTFTQSRSADLLCVLLLCKGDVQLTYDMLHEAREMAAVAGDLQRRRQPRYGEGRYGNGHHGYRHGPYRNWCAPMGQNQYCPEHQNFHYRYGHHNAYPMNHAYQHPIPDFGHYIVNPGGFQNGYQEQTVPGYGEPARMFQNPYLGARPAAVGQFMHQGHCSGERDIPQAANAPEPAEMPLPDVDFNQE